jgi:CopA family copper-resistance protein
MQALLRHSAIVLAALLGLHATSPRAATYDLEVGETTLDIDGKPRRALAVNDSVPGPTLRFREGEDLVIKVTNRLDEDTSVHWHGLILPNDQDGVPGLTYDGIAPGETFTYRFPAQQSGTYWYHSHSGLQEQAGVYGPIVIEPAEREPFRYDREYIVLLSDSHSTAPERILKNLKAQSDYYNYSQRTIGTFFRDVARQGLGATLEDRMMWGEMRMAPTDIADVSGYDFLVNGHTPTQNWTALFEPGERVRLRFINAAAMTLFDVRIPGLAMTVVQADGNNVQPVKVDELRIAVAETYDVIVRPMEDAAFTIFAESMARTGFARGTLAPRAGMAGPVPELRERPLLTMADMMGDPDMAAKHGDMAGMDHSAMPGMDHSAMPGMDHGAMPGMDHGAMPGMDQGAMPGMDHGAMQSGSAADPFYAPGSGLTPAAANGGKFLSYADLKAQKPLYEDREPTREIEIRLTGNMERYYWSINDRKYSEAEPIRLRYGERVRFKFTNETMMTHPMHHHGMWSIHDNGSGKWNPAKHTINVAPATTVYTETEVDAVGNWAFHCHLLYHMETGMFRNVIVEGGPQTAALTSREPAHGGH